MKQVVVIHGGHVFGTYDEYVAHIRNYVIESLEHFTKKRWKDSLQGELGSDYLVIQPRMPCRENAKYLEWKIWFEKLLPFLNDKVILIGHSLGASFLTKYLAENRFPKKILGTFLVAGPYDDDGGRPIAEFAFPPSLSLFQNQSGKIFLYHSQDDKVVSFGELAKFQQALPSAVAHTFTNRGHFNQETFPEFVADIKSL